MEESKSEKGKLHGRNLHHGRYDFSALILASPDLAPFLKNNPSGDLTLDFADRDAVKSLNRALLILYYGITLWDIPTGYLCPAIPGRADYIHHVADLLALSNNGSIPKGKLVRVLDIGVGANCVYPIIGHHQYGWTFVGVDIDPLSVKSALNIVKFNSCLKGSVDIRLQPSKKEIFSTIWLPGEKFDITICNPPFHASFADANAKTKRKWQNLGISKDSIATRNFEGQNAELFVAGGELAFVKQMIRQSCNVSKDCLWFTTLVSNAENIAPIEQALKDSKALQVKMLRMNQGQKTSRVICWTYLSPKEQMEWAR